jgi:hypothetical protein
LNLQTVVSNRAQPLARQSGGIRSPPIKAPILFVADTFRRSGRCAESRVFATKICSFLIRPCRRVALVAWPRARRVSSEHGARRVAPVGRYSDGLCNPALTPKFFEASRSLCAPWQHQCNHQSGNKRRSGARYHTALSSPKRFLTDRAHVFTMRISSVAFRARSPTPAGLCPSGFPLDLGDDRIFLD